MREACGQLADWARIEALVMEAENAFRRQPKALWSDRTYLAPRDAAVLRALCDGAHDAPRSDST